MSDTLRLDLEKWAADMMSRPHDEIEADIVAERLRSILYAHPPDDAGEKCTPAKTPDGLTLMFEGEPLGVPVAATDSDATNHIVPIHPSPDAGIQQTHAGNPDVYPHVGVTRKVVGHVAPDAGDGETCEVCGKKYLTVWKVSDDLWSRVTGHPDSGLMCPRCFDNRAWEEGIELYWECGEDWKAKPAQPDAGEWRGPWRCDKCGHVVESPGWHPNAEKSHSNYDRIKGLTYCGTFRPYDRRAKWDGTERRAGEAELRKVFGDLMRSHAWYTAREYERDTTYNDQSPGYKEEEAANNWFIEKYGADAFYADMTVHPDKSGEKLVCKKCGDRIHESDLCDGDDKHHWRGSDYRIRCGPVEKEVKDE
jgi:hypothetical protein